MAIEQNAVLNGFSNIMVIREALDTYEGTSEFLVSDNVGWGRLANGGTNPIDLKGPISVRVAQLSASVHRHGLALPDLIKVDIEGGEIGMLKGSKELLKRCRPFLLIELHGTNAGIDQLLKEYGYRPYILGDSKPLLHARWDAFVVAAPEEDKQKCEKASNLAMTAALSR